MLRSLGRTGVLVMACVVWLGFANGQHAPEDETDVMPTGKGKIQMLEFNDGSYNYRVPVYMEGKFTEQKKEKECNAAEKLLASLEPLVELVLEDKGLWGVIKKLSGIINQALSMEDALKKIKDSSVPIPDGYKKQMASLFLAIIKKHDKAEVASKEEARKRSFSILNAVKNLCYKSPVGLALNWPKMTVNKIGFVDFSAPVINFVHQTGYSKALGTVRWAAKQYMKRL